jgi:hypothetical protein
VKPAGAWVADPTLQWIIALHVRLSEPIDVERIRSGLTGTGLAGSVMEASGGEARLVERVTAPGSATVRAAVSGRELALGAEHAACDGLGLLALLGAVAGVPATSSAKGVGDRPEDRSRLTAAARRIAEALATPPASVAAPPEDPGPLEEVGDAFARFSVPSRVPVSGLTHAAVRAVVAHNRELSAPHARIAVAIGAHGSGVQRRSSATTAPCSGCARSSGCPMTRCAPPSATRCPSPCHPARATGRVPWPA